MMARLLAATEDPGAPLPEEERSTFEPIIGTTLRDVRIHTGRTAKATAAALGADAFTIGPDIFFRQGQYEPSTRRGQALLAHELAHVGQHTESRRERPNADQTGPDVEEAEAEAVEHAILTGTSDHGGNLTVGRYVRKYATSDGRPVAARDRERLDAISTSALGVCEHLLGPALSHAAQHEIAGLQVDVSLDLAGLSDAQAAEIWGRALANAIQTKLGNVLPNSRP